MITPPQGLLSFKYFLQDTWFWKLRSITLVFPALAGEQLAHDVFEAIVHEQKYLLDSKKSIYLLINSPFLISLLTWTQITYNWMPFYKILGFQYNKSGSVLSNHENP